MPFITFDRKKSKPRKWNSEIFLNNWMTYHDKQSRRNLLRNVARDNYKFVKRNPKNILTYAINKNINTYIDNNHNKMGNIMLMDGTTDDAIVYFHENHKKKKCVAMNFANAIRPGGGYLRGAIAQEEELCRQYAHLYTVLIDSEEDIYPLNNKSAVAYVKNIPRIRENRNHGYAISNKPVLNTSFICAAAPNMNDEFNFDKTFDNFKNEIEKLLKIIMVSPQKANNNEYSCIIIGAFGCGAFAPRDGRHDGYIDKMASCIIDIANDYRHLYDYVIIAIPKNLYGTDNNYNMFKKKLDIKYGSLNYSMI